MNISTDEVYMRQALALAGQAADLGEVPVGCVIVHENQVIAEGYNERETMASALAHAEIRAVSDACAALGRWRLSGCTLYVTLEPCVMCAGALINARVDRVVYGARDPKGGAVESLYSVLNDSRLNHRCSVTGGVMEAECGSILSTFFKLRRKSGSDPK